MEKALSKSTGQKKQNKEGWFNSVVYNAIFFLESSVSNLESNPKNSVIELYTAIELLFKARLMKEHWSLIVSKLEDASIASFENGDFRSVYLEQSEKRLKDICGENFKKEAIDNFKSLGKHRNQIVHFAHTGFNSKKDIVLLEHWASWYYLYDLINNEWSSVFENYKDKFDTVNEKIKENRNFLQAKFDAIQKEITIEKRKGNEVLECTSCRFESAVIRNKHNWGKDFECLVCEVKDEISVDIVASIPCEECGEPMQYFMLDNKCPHCEKEINKGYALNEYNKLYRQDEESEGFDESAYPIGYCHVCESEVPSVVEVEGIPVCILCGVRGWTIMPCEHCSEYVTGDGEKIMALGCHLCEEEYRKTWLRKVLPKQF